MTERIIENEWYAAPGFEGRYEITRDGRVRSLPRFVNSPAAGGQRRIAGKELRLQSIKGYPGFFARDENGRKTSVYMHRLMAAAFVANPDDKPHVNHIDGNKANFSEANLEWVTHAENMRHAHETGLMPKSSIGPGERSPSAKLTWDDVGRIRLLLGRGHTHAEIAQIFGVKKGAIGCIARNETWKIKP